MPVTNKSITFTDTSTGNVSSEWNFGDGTPVVSGGSVIHTYAIPGTYRVTDTIKSPTGKTTTCFQNIQILPQPPPSNNGRVIVVSAAIGITLIVTAYLLLKKDNIPYGTEVRG